MLGRYRSCVRRVSSWNGLKLNRLCGKFILFYPFFCNNAKRRGHWGPVSPARSRRQGPRSPWDCCARQKVAA